MKVPCRVGLMKPKNIKLAVIDYVTQYYIQVLLFTDHSLNDVQYAAVNFCTAGSVGDCRCIIT
jgi:hypothetical protein